MILNSQNELIRRIILNGSIREETAAQFLEQLTMLEYADLKKPIILYIDTYGGNLDAAMLIYDAMQSCVCPIHTIGIGKVMSAGALLLAAGDPGCRHISKHTRVMIHEVSGGVIGSLTEMDISVKEMSKMQELYAEVLSSHTGQPIDKVLADMHQTLYLTAAESVNYGIVDEILPTKKIPKSPQKSKRKKK